MLDCARPRATLTRNRVSGLAIFEGARDEYDDETYTGELTKRVVTVTPATSYPGEEHDYIVTFTAPGPMYNSSLTVTFPSNVLEFPEGRTASNQISVSAPGVSYTVGDITDGGVLTVTVDLTRINNGQKVTITLKDATVAALVCGAGQCHDNDGGWYSATPVTRLTGGVFAPVAGSGTLAVSPDSAKANATLSRITVTYTAATELTNVDLVITVPGDITPSDSSDTVFGTDRRKTGYISSPDTGRLDPA